MGDSVGSSRLLLRRECNSSYPRRPPVYVCRRRCRRADSCICSSGVEEYPQIPSDLSKSGMVRFAQRLAIRHGRDGIAEHSGGGLAELGNAAATCSYMAAFGGLTGKPHAYALYGRRFAPGHAKSRTAEGIGLVGGCNRVVVLFVASLYQWALYPKFLGGANPSHLPDLLPPPFLYALRPGVVKERSCCYTVSLDDGVLLWIDRLCRHLSTICVETRCDSCDRGSSWRYLNRQSRSYSSDAIRPVLPQFPRSEEHTSELQSHSFIS